MWLHSIFMQTVYISFICDCIYQFHISFFLQQTFNFLLLVIPSKADVTWEVINGLIIIGIWQDYFRSLMFLPHIGCALEYIFSQTTACSHSRFCICGLAVFRCINYRKGPLKTGTKLNKYLLFLTIKYHCLSCFFLLSFWSIWTCLQDTYIKEIYRKLRCPWFCLKSE